MRTKKETSKTKVEPPSPPFVKGGKKSSSTLERKITNPELPKIVSDDNVETALYNRAVGMLIPDKVEKDEDNGKITKISYKYEKPDVSACIFWLKNRLPDKWKETKSDSEEKESFKDFIEKFGPEMIKEIEGKK